MYQKFVEFYKNLYNLIQLYPEISAAVLCLLLFLLYKRKKVVFVTLFFFLLGQVVWFWFTSAYEGRNTNQKFKRYQEERLKVDR